MGKKNTHFTLLGGKILQCIGHYWTLRDKNADDAEVKLVAKRASKHFENGDVLLLDSGRSKNPKAQNPSTTIPK